MISILKTRLPHWAKIFFICCLIGLFNPVKAQTIFRDASNQIPPEPIITNPSQGPNASTDTPDVLFADFDEDGDLDVYIADGTNSVFGRDNRLLFNDGQGNFTNVAATNLPASSNAPFGPGPSNSQGIDIADIDNDGDLDVVVANLGNNELFYNNGDGTFSNASNLLPPPPSSPISPFDNISVDAELADVNGDGLLDIFFANEIPPIPPFGPNGSQNLLYVQQANGTFVDETAQRLPVNINTSQKIKTLDIDGDGDLDVLEANVGQNEILINDGNGFFSNETAARLPASALATRGLGLGDIDGDGDVDFIFANSNNLQNQVLINNGSGIFSDETSTRLPSLLDTSVDVELFDIDYDGDLDLLFSNSSLIFGPGGPPFPGPAPNVLYLNDGNGAFSTAPNNFLPASSNSTFAMNVGDLSGDGLDDIFVNNAGNANEELFIRDIRPRTPAFRDPDLRPVLHCVQYNDNGTFTARFGYRNTSGEPLYIPVGLRNRFFNFPIASFEEQPVVFLAGGSAAFPQEIFEVDFTFFSLWQLNGRYAFASFFSQDCNSDKAPIAFEPDKITLYPNPGVNSLNLEGIDQGDLVEVYDLQGKQVASEFGATRFDLEQLPDGLYIVRVNSLTIGKWVKQN